MRDAHVAGEENKSAQKICRIQKGCNPEQEWRLNKATGGLTSNSGIPSIKLCQRDIVRCSNGTTSIPTFSDIPGLVVCYNSGLCWCWCATFCRARADCGGMRVGDVLVAGTCYPVLLNFISVFVSGKKL
jgi:hypothetical protein